MISKFKKGGYNTPWLSLTEGILWLYNTIYSIAGLFEPLVEGEALWILPVFADELPRLTLESVQIGPMNDLDLDLKELAISTNKEP